MSMRRVLFIFSILMIHLGVRGSHIPGGNITYTCLGGNNYHVTLTLFEECYTAFEMNTAKTISIENTCTGVIQTVTLNNTMFQFEVSDICPAEADSSICKTGSIPGFFMHRWEGNVTLTGTCNRWNIIYNTCCRNEAVNLVGISSNYYIVTTLNNAVSGCNSSPVVNDLRVPTFCVGQPVAYSLNALDPDGHELHYHLTGALTGPGLIVPYVTGYTGNQPVIGIQIDTLSGLLTFTPGIQGKFQISIRVEEYDAYGNKIGYLLHDMQFYFENCTNVPPQYPAGGLTNVSGTGTQSNLNTIDICAGGTVCFDLSFSDADTVDTLTVTSNLLSVFPGAVMNVSGTNPVLVNVCLTTLATSNQFYSVSFIARDNACPANGVTYYNVAINVSAGTVIIPDSAVICGPDSIQLAVFGGSQFNWTVLSGDPLVNGVNFSCDTCTYAWVKPAVTTEYIVTSDLSPCPNTDTVKVYVVNDFSISGVFSSPILCSGDTVDYSLSITPAGSYSVAWPNQSWLIPNAGGAQFTSEVAGQFTAPFVVTSDSGCVRKDTAAFVFAGLPVGFGKINASDTIICENEELFLNAFTAAGTGLCALSGVTDLPNGVFTQVGAANTPAGYPTPFMGFWQDGRIQFLLSATELQTAGIGNYIEGFGFYVTQKLSTQPYSSFTVFMECTGLNSISSFQTMTYQVYYDSMYNTVSGLNYLKFPTAYEWDGLSNILVSICFDNGSYTQNDLVYQHTSSFTSCVFAYQDGASGCTLPTGTSGTVRPTVYLKNETINASSLATFNWYGTDPVLNSNNYEATSFPTVNQYYYLDIVDSTGLCPNRDSVYITVSIGGEPYFSLPANDFCIYDGIVLPDSVASYTGIFYTSPAGVAIIDSTTGLIDTSAILTGQPFTIIHETFGIGRCGGQFPVTVQFNDYDDGTFYYPEPEYCTTDGAIILPDTVHTAGGYFFTIPTGVADSSTGEVQYSQSTQGTYQVYYNTNNGSCTSETSVSVEITGICLIEVFNGFTPNNDGFNDFWRIYGLDYIPSTVKVLNRWGDLVWETVNYHSINNHWKGDLPGGEPAPDGTYYYIIEAQGGKTTGYVEINR